MAAPADTRRSHLCRSEFIRTFVLNRNPETSMKNTLALVLYASFLLLALRVQAADIAIDNAIENVITRVDAALAQHRASGDDADLEPAETLLRAALAQAPDDYRAQRSAVALLLARREDQTALTRAITLNARFPDDVDTWALLIDAELALGRYNDAERDTQRLLDLRPDNLPGLARAAQLRELYGDWQGAIDFVTASLNRVTEDQYEMRAARYTQLARLQFGAGQGAVAEQALTAALAAWPAYLPALAEGARQARLRGDVTQALQRAQAAYRARPGVTEQLMLARATAAAGQAVVAAPMLREFAARALASADVDDHAKLALSSYYAFEGQDAARAVSFAASARAQRADVETVLAYATALHRAGRDDEARAPVRALAKLGWRDTEYLALSAALHATLASAIESSNHLR